MGVGCGCIRLFSPVTLHRDQEGQVSNRRSSMSASGQKQTLQHVCAMSALPPKADIGTGPRITFGARAQAAWRYWPQSAAPHLSSATWPPIAGRGQNRSPSPRVIKDERG